ncbi:MAG TPA: hypothetical protein DIS77_01230 [Rothia sp.]|nr:hypothetical protein [Rothia sp. (in: high G+C Gram-positive bacteria)]
MRFLTPSGDACPARRARLNK